MVQGETTDDRVIDGRYALRRLLGRGGMGVVWEADDNVLNRRVALKEVQIPTAVGAESDAVRARVLREARAAARLNHSCAVTTYDVVRDDDRIYIVMELVEVPTLAEIVSREGPLAPERAAAIGVQVAEVLAIAHERGIVHRDVKPGNLMIGQGDRVKLADFGIASVKDDSRITATGLVLGSPSFMAPEQAQSSDSGPPADTWALGATLFYAVEGVPPFDKGSAIPTLAAAATEDPPPARRAGPLAPLIGEMLTKDPERRPSDEELVSKLRALAGEGSASRRSTDLFERTRPVVPQWEAAPEPQVEEVMAEPSDARPWRWVLAAVAALALALGGLWALDAVRDGTSGRRDTGGGVARGGGEASGPQASDPGSSGPGDSSGAGEGSETTESSGPGESTEAVEEPTLPAPSTWTTYTDSATGYSLAYPADWVVRPQSASATTTDFVDLDTGTYLRVDWTDAPGPSPEGAWEQQSSHFAETHDNYAEIRIDPTTYKGYEAALWEYSYSDGGAELHAYNLGFVTPEYGFALNFQARAENWESSQALFERFKAIFQVPA